MSKLLSILLIICTPSIMQGQELPKLPKDETKSKVVYTGVEEIANTGKDVLFKRAEDWVNAFFTNPASVIQSKDAENGKIEGKHSILIYKDVEGTKYRKGMIKYSISILVKDGKYKYEISDIFFLASPKEPIEEWLNENHPQKMDNIQYLNQIHEHIEKLIVDLKTKMKETLKLDKNDW